VADVVVVDVVVVDVVVGVGARVVLDDLAVMGPLSPQETALKPSATNATARIKGKGRGRARTTQVFHHAPGSTAGAGQTVTG